MFLLTFVPRLDCHRVTHRRKTKQLISLIDFLFPKAERVFSNGSFLFFSVSIVFVEKVSLELLTHWSQQSTNWREKNLKPCVGQSIHLGFLFSVVCGSFAILETFFFFASFSNHLKSIGCLQYVI